MVLGFGPKVAVASIEIVVPLRPGGRDRFPVDGVPTRVLECADGNLSRLWRDAYLESDADVVLFKHDDFHIRDWQGYEAALAGLLRIYPIVGVAGARRFDPRDPRWFAQGPARVVMVDGINRGLVAHLAAAQNAPATEAGGFFPTFYGPPGPAVVLDGCCVAVWRRFPTTLFGSHDVHAISGCWDEDFPFHFYDVAFTYNVSRLTREAGLPCACYVTLGDVAHSSIGAFDAAWEAAAARFARKYGGMPALAAPAG